MYEKYWQLNIKPFENAIEPAFFYPSPSHEEALVRLLYVITGNKGCGIITGINGVGKTFTMYKLIAELVQHNRKGIIIPNPSLDSLGILKEIGYRLGVKLSTEDKSELLHIIEDILTIYARDNRNVVIIIDEAQTISNKEAFDTLRMLLNLIYRGKPLITLLFCGGNELEEKLDEELKQIIALKYEIKQLDENETKNYILHRLRVAGRYTPIFSVEAFAFIYQMSKGIPRMINNLCDLALLLGYHKQVDLIDERVINDVAKDLSIEIKEKAKEISLEELEYALLLKRKGIG